MRVKTSRGIVMKLICCAALMVPASVFASQNPPTSGALLTIHGTGASSGIDLKLYDSQIHSGSVQVVPVDGSGGSACLSTAGDNIPTDAYVLQGGAPTGCDPNDPFEVTENNPAGTHQGSGLKLETKFSGFHIETHYLSEPIVHITNVSFDSDTNIATYAYTLTMGADLSDGETIVVAGMNDPNNDGTFSIISGGSGTFTVSNSTPGSSSSGTENGTGTVSNAVCNTAKTICASPDSGFLTVTNDTGSPFSGTISLTGTSTSCTASDSWASGLTTSGAGQSVTLALGTPGTTLNPTEIDSSNCGGFNQPQLLTLAPNVTSIASFGHDDYQIKPLNSAVNPNDTLSVLPVPVPAGPLGSGTFGPFPPGCVSPNCTFLSGDFGKETPSLPSPLRFSAGSFFLPTKYACLPYADFSANGNPVCVELQLTPTGSDPYLYTVQNDFIIDANSLPDPVGGAALLIQHGVNCPTTGFDQNILLSYTGSAAGTDPPIKGSGSGGGTCVVSAFDPNAAAVPVGTTFSSFTGFTGLLPSPQLNLVNPGSSKPLNFTYFSSLGTPVTNLQWCQNLTAGVCSPAIDPNRPWVYFATEPISCSSIAAAGGATAVAGGSNLQNFGSGSYRFNWKTSKTAPLGSCVVVIAQFNTGLAVYPDDFKYAKPGQ